jgi:hypothetical protein
MTFADMIKTPFEQLPEEMRRKVIDFYMAEEKFDLVEMHLHSLNAEEMLACVTSIMGGKGR